MGRRQGVIRLQNGFVRCLTPHEIRRGYIFVSNDKQLGQVLDTEGFEAEIAGQAFPNRRLDVSGRFHVPRRVLEHIGTSQRLRFNLAAKQRLKIERVT